MSQNDLVLSHSGLLEADELFFDFCMQNSLHYTIRSVRQNPLHLLTNEAVQAHNLIAHLRCPTRHGFMKCMVYFTNADAPR